MKQFNSEKGGATTASEIFSLSPSSSLSVWSIMKKKPLASCRHHLQEEVGEAATPLSEDWVTAVAACTSTDLIASGVSWRS